MHGDTEGGRNGGRYGCRDGWTGEQGWMEGWRYGEAEGRTSGWIDGLMDGWRKADSASKVRLGTWQSTNSMTEEGMNQYMFVLLHLWCDTSIHNKYPTISNVRSQSWTHQYD